MALLWLNEHIAKSSYLETDKAKNLAEAMGRYYFRVLSFSQEESVKVGDISIRSDSQRMLEIEEKLKNEAISQCADILKDGEFYFGSC